MMPSRTQGTVSAFGAAGEEPVLSKLGDVRKSRSVGELSMGAGGLSTKAKERVAVMEVVANRRLQQLGREQGGLDGYKLSLEFLDDGTMGRERGVRGRSG